MRNDDTRGSDSRRPGGTRNFARSGGSAGQGRGRSNYANPGPRVGKVYSNVPQAQRVDAHDADSASGLNAAQSYRGNNRSRRDDRAVPERTYINSGRGSNLHDRNQPSPERAYRNSSEPAFPARGEDFTEALPGSREVPVEENENLLAGRNPIREALKAGRSVEKLLVARGDLSGAARDIVRMAREAGAVVQEVDRSRLDAIYPAHQGLLAYVAAVDYASVDDLFARAQERGEDPFFILLDGVTDPHNLGAILRTAECAGAHGAILPERRCAGLGPAAAKAAAGALDCLPVARVKNLNRTIDELKQRGVWVIGTAMAGEDALEANLTGPVALVIGSEGEGVSRLTLQKCDRTLTLPMRGRIESLNASVAAGILMYEVVRARAK